MASQQQQRDYAIRAAGGTVTSPNAFTPWAPPPIPSGYYDPSLDAQRQSAQRGLLYTEQDVGLQGRRSAEDYGTAMQGVDRDWTRAQTDLRTEGRYASEDYDRNVGLLTRRYGQLGRQQAEQARKYGVTSGGIALMSAAKRSENQALERRDLDTGWTRAREGFTTRESRLAEERDLARFGLTRDYDRGVADRGTTLARARSEDQFFGLDTGAQKQYQAQQAGYAAPTGPSNEFMRPDGTRVRVVRRGGWVYTYDPSGRVLDRRRAA